MLGNAIGQKLLYQPDEPLAVVQLVVTLELLDLFVHILCFHIDVETRDEADHAHLIETTED